MASARRFLVAGRLLAPGEVIAGGAFVEVEDGVIARFGPRAALELPAGAVVEALGDDAWLCPGFVDLQVNGGGGGDLMAGADAVLAAGRAHLARGTTAWCPTVITAVHEVMMKALEEVAAAVERAERDDPASLPACLGTHVEGPFLAPAARGVHDQFALRDPDPAEVDEWQAAARGRIRLVTLAPERPGGLETVRALVARGIAVSIGHTEATAAVVRAAADAGARLVTHTFNAMRPLHHREVGPAGVALLDERLRPAVIADGFHVGADALRLFHRVAGGRGFLVTDAASPAGLPPGTEGTFTIGLSPILYAEGRVTDDAGRLAGSALTMDVAVATYAQLAGATPEAALRMATEGPARALAAGLAVGLATGGSGGSDDGGVASDWHRLVPAGRIAVGAPADLVALGPDLALRVVYRLGRRVR